MIPAGAHILIVEDNPDNQKLLSALLTGLGASSVAVAEDGLAGLEEIERHRPDLVLLDVMMPRMDGLEMCRRLREHYPRAELPVLFVTALDSFQERAACFAAGGTDMIAKPFHAPELAARVGVHLENQALLGELAAYQERVAEELTAAREAQRELQPDEEWLELTRRRTGLEIAGVMVTSSELGGDFWAVYNAGPGRAGLLVADFSGHGVAAALNVFRLHAMIRQLPEKVRDGGPATLLGFLNASLNELLNLGQFAAAFAAVFDAAAGTLTYSGALTPPPVLAGNGETRMLEVAGPPLGAFADAEYEETIVAMPPGTTLFAYSDALIESTVDGKPVADGETVRHWVAEAAAAGKCPAATILDHFQSRLPGEPPDDLTLVKVHRPATIKP